MIKILRHPLHQLTLDTDEAFTQALIKQFGPNSKAMRWANENYYDDETKAALNAKIEADKAWTELLKK